MRADLHIHTYYSDGGQSPRDVVLSAKAAGVKFIAVTDHDNSIAHEEVARLAKNAGIIAVDGEEVSAYDGDVKIHILCYNMDYSSVEYKAFTKKITDGAETRTFDILKKLSSAGVNISYGEVIRERKSREAPIHGMYIARAGARKGYASSPFDFYMRYLNFGKAAFSAIARPTPEETVETCVRCGGICSLAHPGRITLTDEGVRALIARLTPLGLRGIEAVYSGHTDEETRHYKEMAEEFGLLVTGGSDTHFKEGNRKIGTPFFEPSEALLSAFKLG